MLEARRPSPVRSQGRTLEPFAARGIVPGACVRVRLPERSSLFRDATGTVEEVIGTVAVIRAGGFRLVVHKTDLGGVHVLPPAREDDKDA
ncbi:MAG: hypothetical protein ACUVSP_09615 [Desulfotomaculales bacterium]